MYVNLRGFGPRIRLEPPEAIRGFLDRSVFRGGIPTGLDGQARYRSVLAARVLIVLDNAAIRNSRPLLPGAPAAMALVTSRNRLPGLVAATVPGR